MFNACQATNVSVTPSTAPNGSNTDVGEPVNNNVPIPSVGANTDTNFTNALWAKPKLGTKWVYSAKLNGAENLGDIIINVTKAEALNFTVNISAFGTASDKTVEYAKLNEFLANTLGNTTTTTEKIDMTIKFQGQESVTVPAATYNAYKVVESHKEKNSSNKTDTITKTEWYVKGIGVVKSETKLTLESGVTNIGTTELKEFKK
ncbi:hypothetical protein EON78_01865 [bacterium]|nr:MAG: hypothetical protein EON78_01865 [bacterium]